MKTTRLTGSILALLVTSTLSTFAAGLYPDGQTARARALGGNDATGGTNPIDSIATNPAGLRAFNRPVAGLSLSYVRADGTFTNPSNSGASLLESGVRGSIALAIPLADRWTAGIGFVPDMAVRGNWRYTDAPGGADGGTSYGKTAHESEIRALRTTAGIAWQATDTLSFGVGIGAVYNENHLRAPYIFQNQATLRTVKTLLDLNTEGTGWGVHAGARWTPTADFTVGLAFRSEVRIESDGSARGDARRQLDRLGLGAARSDFAYDAGVNNTLPPIISLGTEWKATDRLRLAAQVDWIGWARTFDTLVVDLKNGNNRDLNGLTRTKDIHDEIPLNWRDQWVGRIGAEYSLNDAWTLRGGYTYSRSPVPDDTLTPLTAAISEHTLAAGLGYTSGPWTWDLGVQWQIPNSQSIEKSVLAAGEYDRSEVELSTWSIDLTTRYEF
jgi:long-chain fatty acid transport protein